MGQYLHNFNSETEFNTFVKNNYGEPWTSFVEGGSVEYNFPKFVDLGLPSGNVWATQNVGAVSPYDIGDVFTWGDTQPSTSDSYVFGNTVPYTKYNQTDGLTSLLLEDDAANVNYTNVPNGYTAKIPSVEDFREVYDNCTRTTDSTNHLYIFKSKVNGKHLVFPLNMGNGINMENGTLFKVWTSRIYERYTNFDTAYTYGTYSESNNIYIGTETYLRRYPLPVRGVLIPS